MKKILLTTSVVFAALFSGCSSSSVKNIEKAQLKKEIKNEKFSKDSLYDLPMILPVKITKGVYFSQSSHETSTIIASSKECKFTVKVKYKGVISKASALLDTIECIDHKGNKYKGYGKGFLTQSSYVGVNIVEVAKNSKKFFKVVPGVDADLVIDGYSLKKIN